MSQDTPRRQGRISNSRKCASKAEGLSETRHTTLHVHWPGVPMYIDSVGILLSERFKEGQRRYKDAQKPSIRSRRASLGDTKLSRTERMSETYVISTRSAPSASKNTLFTCRGACFFVPTQYLGFLPWPFCHHGRHCHQQRCP